jgi:hypothetical protein
MRRLVFAAVAALVFAPLAGAADKPVEAGHIPATFPLAVTVDAVKLKKNLVALGVPVEKAVAKAKEEKQLDIDSFTRGTLLLSMNAKAQDVVLPAFVVTGKDGIAADLPKIVDGDAEATVAGKKGVKGKGKIAREDMVGTTLDAKTALFGAESAVAAVIEAGAKGGDLATEFGKADLAHDVVAVVAMKPLMAALKEKFGDKLDKEIPPAAEQFWAAAKKLEAATLTVNLAEETLLKGVFRADSAEGAETVKETLQGAVALLSLALPQVKQQLGTQLPPEAAPLVKVIEAMAKTSKFKVDGSTVTMTVARPKDFGK